MLLVWLVAGAAWAGGTGLVLTLDGAVGPASADYLERGLQRAQEEGAELVILEMDTPGGLDTSMRSIIQAITASRVPVVTFVGPSGARAASAGTYILYASHLAAMAPGTNLGAATPVELGGLPGLDDPNQPKQKPTTEGAASNQQAKRNKVVNDAVAYIRSLAELRGRNADWAETAVRSGASLSAQAAMEQGVIELMADDLQALKKALDGRQVQIEGAARLINTIGMELRFLEPDWRSRLLEVIADPNVAYILMLVGVYGLIYEFSNPGALVPGIAGMISLLLALYAFQVLPVNYAGAALILVGLALMIGEAFVPSFGALGVGGVIAFVLGSMILIDTEAPGYGLSVPLVAGTTAASALGVFGVIHLALRARLRPVVSGSEQFIGALGVTVEGFEGRGTVHLHGENWAARSATPIAEGQQVRVVGRKGLTLNVEPESE